MDSDSSRTPPPAARQPAFRAAAVVAVVALVAQLPWALPGVFLWDDLPLLVGSDLYTSPDRWLEALGVPLGIETWYWRPLATTSFLAESLIHGGTATGFRLTAAVLHAVNAACATVLLTRLFRSSSAALFAGAVWAVHPATVEASVWISGRFDLLSALFALCALLWLQPDGRASTTARRIGLAVTAMLALWSKENAITLPVLVALWGLVLARPTTGILPWLVLSRRTWGAVIAGLGVGVIVRLERLGFVFGVNPASAAEAGGALERLLLIGRATTSYLAAIVFPWSGVSPAHHGPRPVPAGDVSGWIGVLLLIGLVGALGLAWRRRARVAWLLAAFLVSLAPVLQIVPLDLAGGLHAADRYLYLPSFFAIAAAFEVGRSLLARRAHVDARRLAVVGVVVVLALGVSRAVTLRHWSSPDRFWAWAVERAPQSSVVLANRVQTLLGVAWMSAEEMQTADEVAWDLHRLDPEFGNAYLLGEVMLAQGRTDLAEKLASQAIQFHGRDVAYRILRGRARMTSGDPEGAGEDFHRAAALLEQDSTARFTSLLPDALAGEAEALLVVGADRFRAEELVDRAESLRHAGGPSAVVQLARARLVMRDEAGTLRALGDGRRIPPPRLPELFSLVAMTEMSDSVTDVLTRQAERTGMPEAAIWSALAFGHEAAGRWKTAVRDYRRAAELTPDSARAWDDLGYALFETGDRAGCEEALRRAVEKDPEYAQARLHLGVLLRKSGLEEEGQAELRKGVELAGARQDEPMLRMLRRQLDIPAADAVDDALRESAGGTDDDPREKPSEGVEDGSDGGR